MKFEVGDIVAVGDHWVAKDKPWIWRFGYVTCVYYHRGVDIFWYDGGSALLGGYPHTIRRATVAEIARLKVEGYL